MVDQRQQHRRPFSPWLGTRRHILSDRANLHDAAYRPPQPIPNSPTTGIRSKHFDYQAQKSAAPILSLIDNAQMRDIFIHVEPGQELAAVWVDQGGGPEREDALRIPAHQVRTLATALISAGNRQLDELHPCVDVTLGDGIRVHAVLAPIATCGAVISIRLPHTSTLSFTDLVSTGLCAKHIADFIKQAIHERKNLLITGGTGTGKTTLLSALLELVSANERIITIEDVAELRPRHPHRIALEARTANSEGTGEVTLDRLLRESLRMRPDRIALGECRGAEIATLLSALNTGHDGGAGTLHASAIHDTAQRLEALGALAGMHAHALARQAVSAFDIVVHLARVEGQFTIAAFGRLRVSADGTLNVYEFTPNDKTHETHS